eukprot:1138845-Pelagomonas_calceolata.AAC.3
MSQLSRCVHVNESALCFSSSYPASVGARQVVRRTNSTEVSDRHRLASPVKESAPGVSLQLQSTAGSCTVNFVSVPIKTMRAPGVYKPSRDTTEPFQQPKPHGMPNGHGPTNTVYRLELVSILVVLRQGHNKVASDNASCLS